MITLEQALAKGSGTERSFNCPVHDDRTASASVNVVKGVWYCYACGAKGKVSGDWVVDPEDLLREVSDLLSTTSTYDESWLDFYDAAGPGDYWLSRFSEETCRHYRFGRHPTTGEPTYPLRAADGSVLGVVRRNLSGDGPKYLYPKGVDVSRLLFGVTPGRHDRAVLVEGAPDVAAARDAGYLAFGIYGSRLHAAQVTLLKRCGVAVAFLALDNDNAGSQGAYDAMVQLSSAGIYPERLRWSGAKDIADLPLERRQNVLRLSLATIAKKV